MSIGFKGAQLAAKARIIGDALTRIGKIRIDEPTVVPSGKQWRYRRKLTLTLRQRDNGWIAGLRRYDDPDQPQQQEQQPGQQQGQGQEPQQRQGDVQVAVAPQPSPTSPLLPSELSMPTAVAKPALFSPLASRR